MYPPPPPTHTPKPQQHPPQLTPSTVIFKAIFKTMCDYLWHCLTCASRLSLSSLSRPPPSISLALFFFFLSRSNQKAKPCRQLRANNKSLPVDIWRWRSDRRDEGGNALWSFPVLKPAHFSPCDPPFFPGLLWTLHNSLICIVTSVDHP